MKKLLKYFSPFKIFLFLGSLCFIVIPFFVVGGDNYINLISSVIGITSLILCAKGNPIGVAIMIVFSVLYGIISYATRYYGEMITYLGMTLPMSVIALVSWLKNPAKQGKKQVKVGEIKGKEWAFMLMLTGAVTLGFYFILKALDTANLGFSTLSVATSFSAAYFNL